MNVPDAPSSDRKRGRQRSTDHTAPSPARRRGCNCKKSGCLKLYCECFAANVRCGERCQCLGCKNREHNRLEIAHAMETIERRTQKSFKSPLAVARKLETLRNTTPGGIPMDQSVLDGATRLLMSAERLEEAPTPVVHPECICSAGACSTACPCHQKYGNCGQRCPCKAVPMSQEKTRGCSCKKSNCLKLYCECLGAQRYCDSRCNCEGCKNRPDNQAERERAISAILERNPLAFQPKVASGASQHLRGCNCRKSNCMKNYCECHQAGVPCTSRCACQGCRNTETFVSAKKMLVFGAESKADTSSPDMSERSAASTGKPPRRPQRRVSMDLSASPSQFRTPIAQRPSALELLSQTAPPAPPQALVFGQTSSSIVKRKLGDTSRTVDRHPSGFERRKFTKIASARPSFKDRLEKASRVVKVLPPVEGTLDAEYNSSASDLPLSKLCRSLIRAAGSVDSELNNDGGDSVMEEVDGDDKRNGSFKVASQPDEGSRGPLSPTTETLMCEEDIETPGRNAYSSDMPQNNEPDVGGPQIKKEENQERRIQLAALQERAVLQEFSVWLRNLSTGSSLLTPPQ